MYGLKLSVAGRATDRQITDYRRGLLFHGRYGRKDGDCSLTILTPPPLPQGTVGSVYSQELTATGGVTPYRGWALAAEILLENAILLTADSSANRKGTTHRSQPLFQPETTMGNRNFLFCVDSRERLKAKHQQIVIKSSADRQPRRLHRNDPANFHGCSTKDLCDKYRDRSRPYGQRAVHGLCTSRRRCPCSAGSGWPGCGRRRWWTSWRPRRSRRRAAVHPCSRCEGPESSPFQLGLVYGHAPKQRGTRPAHVARIPGQGHHSSGWTALQCNDVSNQHQLPDVRRADSVHGHSAQWPGVLQCRSPQWSVCLERRHSRCRTPRG